MSKFATLTFYPLSIVLAISITTVDADVVVLEGGSQIPGHVVRESDQHVIVHTGGAIYAFPRAQVERVVRGVWTLPTEPKQRREEPAEETRPPKSAGEAPPPRTVDRAKRQQRILETLQRLLREAQSALPDDETTFPTGC